MNIKPTDEYGRFYVKSEKGDKEYLVDVSPDEYSYGCECNDFNYVVYKRIQKGVPKYSYEGTCKHQRAVLKYLGLKIERDTKAS